MLRSDLCNYSDAYIVVKRVITLKAVAGTNINKKTLHLKIAHRLGHNNKFSKSKNLETMYTNR